MKNRFLHTVMAVGMTALTLAAQAQSSDSYVRTIGQAGSMLFTDVDSVVLREQPVTKPVALLTPDDVRELADYIYIEYTPALLAELSSDNFVDNNVEVPSTNISPTYGFLDQMFSWEPVAADDRNSNVADAPLKVWSGCLLNLAIADSLVAATSLMETQQPSLADEMRQLRGEAMLMRAHIKMTLGNVFATKFTDSEIEADITAGLPLLGNANEGNARRMNQRAAHALAARYYLLHHNWQQVLLHTNAALGDNPSGLFRPWADYQELSGIADKLALYYDSSAKSNFLVEHTYSLRDRIIFNRRYGTNGNALMATFSSSGPNWRNWLPAFSGNLYVSGDQQYGVWLFRAYEFFEYTDPEAGIGFVRNDYTPYTAEETLLMRAEARFYLGNTSGCLADLNLWTQSKLVTDELTMDMISSFYDEKKSYNVLLYMFPVDMEATGWSAQDISCANNNKSLLYCLLHFRRIETVYDGLRWMDIRRYGMTIDHATRYPYAVAKTVSIDAAKGYLLETPAGYDEFKSVDTDICMKNDSVYTFGMQPDMVFGNDLAADEEKQESMIQEIGDAPNGWLMQEFIEAGEGANSFLEAAQIEVNLGGDMVQIYKDNYTYTYNVVSHQPGEIVLKSVTEDQSYPVLYRLTPLNTDWDTYNSQCSDVVKSLTDNKFQFHRDGTNLLFYRMNYFDMSHTSDDRGLYGHVPFVPTPTGVRFASEEVFGCNPEFTFDATSQTLTSLDGKVQFVPEWSNYLNSMLKRNSQLSYDITVENPSAEWQQVIADITAGLSVVNSKFSFGSVCMGGVNVIYGLGIKFRQNSTQFNYAGIAADIQLNNDGTATISVPGLDTDQLQFSQNMNVLISRNADLKPAIVSLLRMLQGNYTYTYDRASGTLRMVGASGMTFTLTIE